MTRRRKRWAKTIGGYGHRVTVCERAGSTHLSLRWWDPTRKELAMAELGAHRSRAVASRRPRRSRRAS